MAAPHANRPIIGGRGVRKWSQEEFTVLDILNKQFDLTFDQVEAVFHDVYPKMKDQGRPYNGSQLRDQYKSRFYDGKNPRWFNVDRPNIVRTEGYDPQELATRQLWYSHILSHVQGLGFATNAPATQPEKKYGEINVADATKCLRETGSVVRSGDEPLAPPLPGAPGVVNATLPTAAPSVNARPVAFANPPGVANAALPTAAPHVNADLVASANLTGVANAALPTAAPSVNANLLASASAPVPNAPAAPLAGPSTANERSSESDSEGDRPVAVSGCAVANRRENNRRVRRVSESDSEGDIPTRGWTKAQLHKQIERTGEEGKAAHEARVGREVGQVLQVISQSMEEVLGKGKKVKEKRHASD